MENWRELPVSRRFAGFGPLGALGPDLLPTAPRLWCVISAPRRSTRLTWIFLKLLVRIRPLRLLEESARLLEPNHKPEFLINARENDGPPAPVGSIVPEGSLLQHWLLRQIFSTLLCLANHADIYHCARDAIRPPPFLRSVKSPNCSPRCCLAACGSANVNL